MYIADSNPNAYNLAMVFRFSLVSLVLTCLALTVHADPLPQAERVMLRSTESLPAVDHLVVHKTERRLLLLHGETVVRSYKIALGLNPVGTKERAGDFRTPEGHYYLSRRNPRSDYFLSIQVSYPNETDMRRAHKNHWDAGGSIMIHGLPNQLKHEPRYYEISDWTDGCIALSNADMVEVWLLTPDNAPIDILP
jgi:murein L,D-transpeptidase YafK